MLIGIIGESCTGKSTLAEGLKTRLNARVFSGKDYLRLAKNEQEAKNVFSQMLSDAVAGENLIYVIAEKEHLSLLPDGAVKVLMTADIALIEERFAKRMHGILPPPVRTMLHNKHGIFDGIACQYRIHNGENTDLVCNAIACSEGQAE